MIWTKEKPTQPGWYWFYSDMEPKQIVYVYEGVGGWFIDFGCGNATAVPQEACFAGPIEEPEEQP